MESSPAALLAPTFSRYVPHRPTPKQHFFLLLSDLGIMEAFYGGAAGGGKSNVLLMAAMQYIHVHNYAALILRRSFTDLALPGALMDRARDWLQGKGPHWNEPSKTWTFPEGGTLTFGYLEKELDKYRYQSSEFQFIGFDELTQFVESQYIYLFSRLRRLRSMESLPLRVYSASNPGGVGHIWVKERFIDSANSERVFVPAKLGDNPYIDRESYMRSLAELDPVTRRQLLDGDWTARVAGSRFRAEWFTVVSAAPIVADRVRFWDLAASRRRSNNNPDWTVGARVARSPDGRVWIEDIRRIQETPGTVEKLVRQTAEFDGVGIRIRMEEEPGASGKSVIDHYTRSVLSGWDFRGVRSTGPKKARAGPLSSQAQAGNVMLIRGAWNKDFIEEAETFPDGPHDDQIDASSGAFAELTVSFMGETDTSFVVKGGPILAGVRGVEF